MIKTTLQYFSLLGFLGCITLPALAQTDNPPATTPSAPVLLLPNAGLVGTEELPTGEQIDTPQTIIIETSSGGIAVESLQQIDPEILGTLTPSTGDLGFEMWDGTSRQTIHQLIATLPSQINSATLRDITKRLLLTTADIKPLPKDAPTTPTLTKLRVEKLMTMGLLDDVVALIQLAEQTGVADSVRPDVIEAHLFLNNYSDVCTQVALSDDKLGEAYWQKLLVFCQALAGDTSGAEFGTTLLADMGEDDPIFFTLIEKFIQKSATKLTTMPNPSALNLALAQLTETALPEDVLNTQNPSILRAIVANNTTPLDIRLQAAERAGLIGTVPVETLANIYKSVEFSPEELANPISAAEASNTPRSRALLYQAADQETIPEARALIIQKAIQLAKQAELYPLVIKVHQKHILQMQASIDVWWFAGDAARALYASNRPLPAQAWLGHLRTQALREPEAQAQLVDFWPLAGISAKGLLPEINDEARRVWVDGQLTNSPDERAAHNRITMGYMLLDALDQKVPANAWTELAMMAETNYARLPNPAINQMMINSAMAGRQGETIAWVVKLLGELGTSHASPETTAQAVTALRALGLQKEARAIALESAIQNGL